MILLALIPPAWNRVMDPRVLNHFDGDISRANISPRKRSRILTKHLSIEIVTTVESSDAKESHSPQWQSAACPGCGYTYRMENGDLREGFGAGTPFSAIPDSWNCPDCGVCNKSDFTVLTAAKVF